MSSLDDEDTGLVKGCPCYKEFGKEQVCINNDDVQPISSIMVDPTFFPADSVEDLKEFRSDNENMCYLLIFLDDKSNSAYCVSQGKKIRINSRPVQASDIREALQFVTSAEKSGSGVICSTCLYKYLVTMGDVFEDLLSESERAKVISEYIQKIAAKMAVDLTDATEDQMLDKESYNHHLKEYIKDLMTIRGDWSSLIFMYQKRDGNSDLLDLMEHYKTLARLEAIFLFQVLTIRDATDELVALGLLRFMIEVAEKVSKVIDSIRESHLKIKSLRGIPTDIHEMLKEQNARRIVIEQRFSNVLKVLSQVDVGA
ncbi:MAG: hypothetical protein GF411_09605 [Candidatus Lokiarchaeota archaeon]|nr:hypothetical protein [Candidatus Lokiarchaeota archaeon]